MLSFAILASSAQAQTFGLTYEKFTEALPVTLAVHDAPAGSVVVFLQSHSLGSTCRFANNRRPAVCTSLDLPREIGRATADANGDAAISFVNPSYDGGLVRYQAVWLGRVTGAASNVVRDYTTDPVLEEGTFVASAVRVTDTCSPALQIEPLDLDVSWPDTSGFLATPQYAVPLPDVQCTYDAGVFDCLDYDQDIPIAGLGVVVTLHSTLTDENRVDSQTFEVFQHIDATCSGANCPALPGFGFTMPCTVELDLTFTAAP